MSNHIVCIILNTAYINKLEVHNTRAARWASAVLLHDAASVREDLWPYIGSQSPEEPHTITTTTTTTNDNNDDNDNNDTNDINNKDNTNDDDDHDNDYGSAITINISITI